ncbi:MAG TPA: carboxypeptidase regulatory-like domain-containing protein [Stellaceae bacterium]|nr:carboxypeptidase regulatory-like domain-containing protein [Stellaceae bacterium]
MRAITLGLMATAAGLIAAHGTLAKSAAPILTGHVSSAEEGAMEGVVVSAKADGSTITTSVVSDKSGAFAFPAGRLPPGHYALTIRAVGYVLDGTPSADIGASPLSVDLRLGKTKNLAGQLTNTEWTNSAPGTEDQKAYLLNCTGCHTLERIFRSTHDADEFVQVLTRMAWHAPGSMPSHPQNRVAAPDADNPERFRKAAEYLASINLSQSETWPFELKTLPRPSGAATKVIITEYDIPRPEAMPHDVVMDKNGMIWYSDFGSQVLGSLDPKTGKITDYTVPTLKADAPTGLLDLEFDKDNNLWLGLMLQGGVAKFDRTTHKFQTWSLPAAINNDIAQQAMVVPYRDGVDGKVWMNNVGLHEVHRVTLASGTFETFAPFASLPKGRPHDIYGTFADSHNNLYGSDFGDNKDAQMVRVDAKTGKVTFYPIPTPYARPRRGRMDAQDRLFFAEYRGDKVAMLDTKAETFKEWAVPAGTWPYDVIWDKDGYLWTGGMSNDRVIRINMKTGATVAYLLPRSTNIRRVIVDNRTEPPTLWTGSNHGGSIVKVEPQE